MSSDVESSQQQDQDSSLLLDSDNSPDEFGYATPNEVVFADDERPPSPSTCTSPQRRPSCGKP